VAFRCETCKNLLPFRSDLCVAQGHTLVKQSAVKRFFECSSCRCRVTNLNSRFYQLT
jgi:hypothetical protein